MLLCGMLALNVIMTGVLSYMISKVNMKIALIMTNDDDLEYEF